jgi:hypothetical protein
MRRRPTTITAAVVASFLILLAGVFAVQWLLSHLFTQPPPTVEKPPIISDARNMQIQRTDKPEGKIITYETPVDPNAVYRFYEDTLVKDGWGGLGYFSKPQIMSWGIIFEWDQSGINGCEGLGYRLQVLAEKTDLTITHVQLALTKINPC